MAYHANSSLLQINDNISGFSQHIYSKCLETLNADHNISFIYGTHAYVRV